MKNKNHEPISTNLSIDQIQLEEFNEKILKAKKCYHNSKIQIQKIARDLIACITDESRKALKEISNSEKRLFRIFKQINKERKADRDDFEMIKNLNICNLTKLDSKFQNTRNRLLIYL